MLCIVRSTSSMMTGATPLTISYKAWSAAATVTDLSFPDLLFSAVRLLAWTAAGSTGDVVLVLRIDDSQVARQSQLGLVELIDAADVLVLRLRERGLCLDYGQVVVDSSLKPVGGLFQGFGRQLDIAAGDVDEFGGGLQI